MLPYIIVFLVGVISIFAGMYVGLLAANRDMNSGAKAAKRPKSSGEPPKQAGKETEVESQKDAPASNTGLVDNENTDSDVNDANFAKALQHSHKKPEAPSQPSPLSRVDISCSYTDDCCNIEGTDSAAVIKSKIRTQDSRYRSKFKTQKSQGGNSSAR